MLSWIREFTTPPVFEDEEKSRTAGLLNTILIVVFAIGFGFPLPIGLIDLIFNHTFSYDSFTTLAAGWLLAACTFGLRYLLYRGHLKLAGSILLGVFWSATTYSVMAYQGIRGQSIPGYFLLITIGGLILGGPGILASVALSLLAIVASFLGEIYGVFHYTFPPLPEAFELLANLTTVVVLGLLLRHSLRTTARWYQRARQQTLDLAEINRTLQANQTMLEVRSQELERRAIQLQTAAEVARDASAIHDVDRLLDEAVRLISSRFGFYHAGVFLIDNKGDFAVLRAASSGGGERMLQRGHKLAVGKVGIVGFVTGTGQPRISLDVGTDSVHFAHPDLPATRSEIALPLRVGDDVIGALDVQSTQPDAFDEDDIVVLQTMADQLALAIENARLIQRQTFLANQRQRIIELNQQLAEQTTYDRLISQSPRLIAKIFGYPRVVLAALEGQELVIRGTAALPGAEPVPLGLPFTIGQGALGRAVGQRTPLVVTGTSLDFEDTRSLHVAPNMTTVALPLISRGSVLGALGLELESHVLHREEDIRLFELLASQVAASLENTRLYEETQRSFNQLDSLYRQQVNQAWTQFLANKRAKAEEFNVEFGEGGEESENIEAPISLHGEVIGSLTVHGPNPIDLTEENEIVLQSIAEEVAETLEQIRLIEEVNRRAAQLQTAAEIARDATGLLDEHTLLQRAVNLIRDRFGYYHASVFLIDDGGQTAILREATGEAGQKLRLQGHRLRVGSKSIIGYVTLNGERYLANDIADDPYHRPNPLLPETKSELAIPLKVGDRVIGALDVQHDQPYAFGEDDLAVLEILVDQLAVAVQNARLFASTRREAEREKAVIEITGKIRASENIDEMVRTALTEMREALGAKRARIRLRSLTSGGDGQGEDGQDRPSSDPDGSALAGNEGGSK